MKISIKLSFLVLVISLVSCASAKKFPLSPTVPAAEITVTKKTDKNKNYSIEIKAKNLAGADRLNPAKKVYVVWIVTDDNGNQNLGQLKNKNGGRASLKAVTPYIVKQVFITAEDQSNISFPAGTEITRISL